MSTSAPAADALDVLIAYGLSVEEIRTFEGDIDISGIEFSFHYSQSDQTWQVVAWTGSYPFAEDHPMGEFAAIEDAARYAKWLLARENFYHERDEAMMAQMSEEPLDEQGNLVGNKYRRL